jgi:hypothetical protein
MNIAGKAMVLSLSFAPHGISFDWSNGPKQGKAAPDR